MNNKNEIERYLIAGFLAGGIIGGLIGIIYVPKSGIELRGDIKVKTDNLVDDVEDNINQSKKRASGLINSGKQKSEYLISDATIKINSLLGEVENNLEKAKKRTKDLVETAMETKKNKK